MTRPRALLITGALNHNQFFPKYYANYQNNPIAYWIDDFVFKEILDNKVYDKFDIADKTILDIGAHIGTFSLKCILEGAKEVYSFEADSINFQFLMENTDNYSDRIHPFNLAIGKENKITRLKYGHLSGSNKVGHEGDVEVITQKIDSISNLPKIDIVKMDIEGNEADAIMGMREMIERDHPKFIVACEHSKEEVFEIQDLMIELGYKTEIKGEVVFAWK